MSVPTSPTTPTPKLDSLREMQLKGFGSCQDSPSSRTASLPTPGIPTVPLADSVMDASIGDDDAAAAADQWPLITPGAPLLKDMDSFTEGTGAGSFDSIPAAETDEHGNPIYPLSEARVSLVAEPQDKSAYVLRWLSTLPGAQTSVHNQNRPRTLKRARSVTEVEEYRPRRPRTRSCPSSRRSDSRAPD